MLQGLSYKYYRKLNAKTVYLVLHGGGPWGVETPFISSIIDSLTGTGNSVLGFNFPYCERGEEKSSGPELTEETAALNKVIKFLRSEGYEKINIVAKSLGGVTASYWLEQHAGAGEYVSLIIFGYVIGSVRIDALKDKLHLVIQGGDDRFGNAAAVKNELVKHGVEADVAEIAKADHSYRSAQGEPTYQKDAINILLQYANRV